MSLQRHKRIIIFQGDYWSLMQNLIEIFFCNRVSPPIKGICYNLKVF